jgi:tetratricopeptide (TPR) repeat protein
MKRARWLVILLAAAALGVAAVPAGAATQKQQAWCFDDAATDEQRIAGCTAVIGSATASPAEQGAAFLNRGVALTNQAEFRGAIADFGEAIRLNPAEAAIALSNRCAVRALVGQLEPALRDCDQAVALTPDDPQGRTVRGMLLLKMGEFRRARDDFDAALAEVPDDALSLFGRGLARRATGDTAGGTADMEAARALAADIESWFVDSGISI